MTKHPRPGLIAAAACSALMATVAPVATAAVVFENLPTSLTIDPLTESHHNAIGPILADDFKPAEGGLIYKVEWWGQRAQSNDWEIAFHTDAPGQPNIDNPVSGSDHMAFVTAAGVQDDPNHADIFHYTVQFPKNVGIFEVNAGQEYWFTVANFLSDWHWANAGLGPTIGGESYNAHQSIGGICTNGGPHCGPWTDVHQDFAFKLTVPEPGSFGLAGAALLLAGLGSRRGRRVGAMPVARAA